jgi:hypothetical protein
MTIFPCESLSGFLCHPLLASEIALSYVNYSVKPTTYKASIVVCMKVEHKATSV